MWVNLIQPVEDLDRAKGGVREKFSLSAGLSLNWDIGLLLPSDLALTATYTISSPASQVCRLWNISASILI